MKITVTNLPESMTDEEGTEYPTKSLIATGRLVNYKGKFLGWQVLFGHRLLRVLK
jgi:hypothetical protein